MYYTIGQRKGLGIGGVKNSKELPWYVVDKITCALNDQGKAIKNSEVLIAVNEAGVPADFKNLRKVICNRGFTRFFRSINN